MNRFVVLAALLAYACGNVALPRTPNHLHPVHGLYVKPSEDGTTGDLYVAATEDSGSKTQWLTDQPVHFLPTHAQESLNTKRAIASPALQYAYALPVAGNTENAAPTYSYALPTVSQTPATTDGKTEVPATAAIPQYNPYQYFYPQMMSAYANMMTVLKDAGMSEETASSVVSQPPSMWSPSYSYPVQYVMVDPNMWAQAQSGAAAAATTPASATENESE